MGIVRTGEYEGAGLHRGLCEELHRRWEIDDFVETGTWEGHTAKWAASVFPRVYTVEMSRPIYEGIGDKNKYVNVEWYFGDSTKYVPKVVGRLGSRRAIFWLDAHYSYARTAGKDRRHPLVDEVRAAVSAPVPHVIFIDDFRLLAFPVPEEVGKPFEFPSFDEVYEALQGGKHRFRVYFAEDWILAGPPEIKGVLVGMGRNSFKCY